MACYLENTPYIIAVDLSEKPRFFPFYISIDQSLRSNQSPSFVTLRWNKDGSNRFIVVFNYEGKKIFKGSIGNQGQKESLEAWIDDDTADSSNYAYNGDKVFYISDKHRAIYSYPGRKKEFNPNLPPKWMLMEFDISSDGTLYYTTSDPDKNRIRIYGGKPLKESIHGQQLFPGGNQQFYPQFSPDSRYIGFVEKDELERAFYPCVMPTAQSPLNPIRSKRKYIDEQNALLREYDHFHFIDNNIYSSRLKQYYRESHQNPIYEKTGLFCLNATDGQESYIDLNRLQAVKCRTHLKITIDDTSKTFNQSPIKDFDKNEDINRNKTIDYYRTLLIYDVFPYFMKNTGENKSKLVYVALEKANVFDGYPKFFYGLAIIDAAELKPEDIR